MSHAPINKYVMQVSYLSPRDILPLSDSGCLNFCTFGWVTPIIINIYRKGVDTLQSFRLADRDAAEANSLR